MLSASGESGTTERHFLEGDPEWGRELLELPERSSTCQVSTVSGSFLNLFLPDLSGLRL